MKVYIILILFLSHINLFSQNLYTDSSISYSYCIKNTGTSDVIKSINSEKRLIPASLLKVVTSATALELLGPNYQYKTIYGYSGELKNGILNGNIVIKAGFDPTLGSKYFKETKKDTVLNKIVKELKSIGVKKVLGSIRIEKDKEVPYSPSRLWEDMGNYYGAKPNAFNWHDNLVYITLTSKEAGEKCIIKNIDPEIYPHILKSKVKSATHQKDSAYVYGCKETMQWWIEGSIPQNRTEYVIKGALPNAELSFKNQLINLLQNAGVSIDNNKQNEPNNFNYLGEIKSPQLKEIIKIVNQKSNNLFADALLITLGKEYGNTANWDSAINVLTNFWKEKIEFSTNFRIKDGSGLSPKNLVTAQGIVELLEWMELKSLNSKVFEESLAIGGKSGTLKNVFRNNNLKGRVIGKSGSMEGVLGYCGYYTQNNKNKIAFCVLVNNYIEPTKNIRKKAEELLVEYFIAQ